MRANASAALIALTIGACAPRSPVGADGLEGQAPKIPPGCEANLSGDYVHAENPTFRYRGQDDGTTFKLVPQSAQTADAGSETADPTRVVLTRTPEGFIGKTQAQALAASGARCPV